MVGHKSSTNSIPVSSCHLLLGRIHRNNPSFLPSGPPFLSSFAPFFHSLPVPPFLTLPTLPLFLPLDGSWSCDRCPETPSPCIDVCMKKGDREARPKQPPSPSQKNPVQVARLAERGNGGSRRMQAWVVDRDAVAVLATSLRPDV